MKPWDQNQLCPVLREDDGGSMKGKTVQCLKPTY